MVRTPAEKDTSESWEQSAKTEVPITARSAKSSAKTTRVRDEQPWNARAPREEMVPENETSPRRAQSSKADASITSPTPRRGDRTLHARASERSSAYGAHRSEHSNVPQSSAALESPRTNLCHRPFPSNATHRSIPSEQLRSKRGRTGKKGDDPIRKEVTGLLERVYRFKPLGDTAVEDPHAIPLVFR